MVAPFAPGAATVHDLNRLRRAVSGSARAFDLGTAGFGLDGVGVKHGVQALSRSSRRSTLPTGVLGRSVRNSTILGRL